MEEKKPRGFVTMAQARREKEAREEKAKKLAEEKAAAEKKRLKASK